MYDDYFRLQKVLLIYLCHNHTLNIYPTAEKYFDTRTSSSYHPLQFPFVLQK